MSKHVVLWLAVSSVTLGCGSGMTTEEATDRCSELERRLPTCFNDEVRTSCVSCYEACGTDCEQSTDCPSKFSCER